MNYHKPRRTTCNTSAVACSLLLVACGSSVEDRFEKMCAEHQEIGGEFAAASESACKYGDYLPAEDKRAAVEMWDELKAKEADLEDLIEEGERQGFETE